MTQAYTSGKLGRNLTALVERRLPYPLVRPDHGFTSGLIYWIVTTQLALEPIGVYPATNPSVTENQNGVLNSMNLKVVQPKLLKALATPFGSAPTRVLPIAVAECRKSRPEDAHRRLGPPDWRASEE